jgi:chemotaxis signal transduction protein
VSAAHLLVRTGDMVAALPAAAVRRVVQTPRLHPLPGAGGGLLGLVEFAGEPLAVLDLARLLGAAGEEGAARQVTVVAWAGAAEDRELLGLAVDEALEVIELDVAAAGAGGELLARDRPVRLVDLESLGGEGG